MDIAVLVVRLHVVVRTVVSVLVREHADVLGDGAVTSVVNDGSTSAHLLVVEGSVVVEGILQREILQVEVRSTVVKHISTA